MIITTKNSIYEFDDMLNRLRRLSGQRDPKNVQGKDGVWNDVVLMRDLRVGQSMIYVNRKDYVELDNDCPVILTSKIISIED